MELLKDDVKQENSKITTIIGICIVILSVIIVFAIIAIIYLKNSITTINIDGIKNTKIEELIYIASTEEGKELYIPIIKIAEFLGYEGFTGDYKIKSEDTTKCHVVCENETAMFSLDSDMLIKIANNSEKEYIKIDKPVFEKDGELYTTIDGIQKAFNVSISCDTEFKNIDIYTMDFLVKYWALQRKLDDYTAEFKDQKAIFEDMLITEKENAQYGVIKASTGEIVLQPKYEEVKYLPVTKEFLVKSNGKYGVMNQEKSIVINTIYDEITIMDNQIGIYLVKQNNAYGIIDIKGNIILDVTYKKIGIDNANKYVQNGVENEYILLDEIIPVKNTEDLWSFFNIKGEKLTEFEYVGIGCENATASNSYPTIVIPKYKCVIVKQSDKKYGVYSLDDKKLVGEDLDSVYLRIDISTGENKYYMERNKKVKEISVEN